MHWLLAALLLVGAVDLSTSIGVSVNTSTSNLDEAAGSASVPGKGYVSETNVGPNPNQISPPKQVPPAGGGGGGGNGIVIVSNSHVLNGTQVNKVDTVVESFKTTRRAWMQNPGQRPSQGVEIPNIINIIPPMPPLPPPVLFPPGFPNGRSSDVSNVSSKMSTPSTPSPEEPSE